jgi:hypothetical protein
MLKFAVASWAGVDESVTCTVKLVVPVAIGVPEITPLVLRERPGGNKVPPVRVQVYGWIPLLACKVWL